MEIETDTYVFSYGSNHPYQISNRLHVPIQDVFSRWRACTLKNHKRAFMGSSPAWDNTSPATVIENPESEINAFAFLMTPAQVGQMDAFEYYPIMYIRKEVELVDKSGEKFNGIVYVMNPCDDFTYPSPGYLNAWAKTFQAFHYFPPMKLASEYDYKTIKFEVCSAVDGSLQGECKINELVYDEDTKQLQSQ